MNKTYVCLAPPILFLCSILTIISQNQWQLPKFQATENKHSIKIVTIQLKLTNTISTKKLYIVLYIVD